MLLLEQESQYLKDIGSSLSWRRVTFINIVLIASTLTVISIKDLWIVRMRTRMMNGQNVVRWLIASGNVELCIITVKLPNIK